MDNFRFNIVDRSDDAEGYVIESQSSSKLIALKKNVFQKHVLSGYKNYQLYVHVPFCFFHCSFCVYKGQLLDSKTKTQQFMDILRYEAQTMSPIFQEITFSSAYIGGGTVSTLSSEQIMDLYQILIDHFNIDMDIKNEFTIELAPHSLDLAKIDAIKSQRFTRVSLGIQSLDKDLLKRMNRPYVKHEKIARIIGEFVNGNMDFNVDLMVGIDGRTMRNLMYDFALLSNMGCNSIMIYVDMNKFRSNQEDIVVKDAIKMIKEIEYNWSGEYILNKGEGIKEYNRFIKVNSGALEFDNRYTTDFYATDYLCLGLGPGGRSFTKDYLFSYVN